MENEVRAVLGVLRREVTVTKHHAALVMEVQGQDAFLVVEEDGGLSGGHGDARSDGGLGVTGIGYVGVVVAATFFIYSSC